MKQYVIKTLLTIAMVATHAAPSFAGAWTAKQGAYYDKLAFNYYYSHETFDTTGKRSGTPNNGTFTDYNLSNYFEYGVFDSLTVINSIAYKWLENEDNTNRTTGTGVGDVDLGLRYKLLDSDKVGIVSSQLLVKIPGDYSKNDSLPLGNGQYDTELRLLYGRSLYPLVPGYGNVEIGYRWRAEDPSDELRYLIEFGVDVTKTIYTRAKLDGTMSIDNGKKLDGSGNPTTTNNFDLGKLDLTVGYKVAPNWGIEASYVPALYGQNTAAGATYSLALYLKTP
jgi:protein XagA